VTPYYSRDGITIYHGDSTTISPAIAGIDVVLTDPFYGVEGTTEKSHYAHDFEDTPASVVEVAVPLINFWRTKARRVVVTPGLKSLFQYPAPDSFGVIFYPAAVSFQRWGTADTNPILYYGEPPRKGPCSFASTERAKKNGHPCPKPIGQWTRLLRRISEPGDLILDPFMGSGTTLRAAKDLGLQAIGIDIEESYCEIAAKRLAQEVLFA